MARTKKLFRATNDFCDEMKKRLVEKAECGFIGWDNGQIVSSEKLFERSVDKMTEVRKTFSVSPSGFHNRRETMKNLVDIANFCMMLYHRAK